MCAVCMYVCERGVVCGGVCMGAGAGSPDEVEDDQRRLFLVYMQMCAWGVCAKGSILCEGWKDRVGGLPAVNGSRCTVSIESGGAGEGGYVGVWVRVGVQRQKRCGGVMSACAIVRDQQ